MIKTSHNPSYLFHSDAFILLLHLVWPLVEGTAFVVSPILRCGLLLFHCPFSRGPFRHRSLKGEVRGSVEGAPHRGQRERLPSRMSAEDPFRKLSHLLERIRLAHEIRSTDSTHTTKWPSSGEGPEVLSEELLLPFTRDDRNHFGIQRPEQS